MEQLYLATLGLLLALPLTTGYSILVFMPYGSHSHKTTLMPLIKGLVERNHSVTFITNQESPDLVHYKMYHDLDEVVVPGLNYSMLDPNSEEQNFFHLAANPSVRAQLQIFKHLSGLVDRVIQATYSDQGVQRVLKTGRFDLLLLSQVVSYAGYPLAWHFKCPYILASPNVLMTDSAFLMGDSEHTDYVPFFMSTMTDKMSLLQRVINTAVTHSLSIYQDHFVFPRIQPTIDRYFPGSPSLVEMKANLSAAFSNTHPAFNYPRANPPGVVELGGIHCRAAKKLPRYIENFVSDPEGFVLFGVGSIIKMDEMPKKMLDVFLRVFARLDQRVVWQWKGTHQPANISDNVLLLDWLPQQDLLGHKNCKVFMTHGGLLSTQEAVYHGVPVLGLPFISDQLLNMDKAVRDGYAIQMNWGELDEDRLYEALKQLIHDGRYAQKVQHLKGLLHDQPETPLERGIYWTEYFIRHQGAGHLKLGSRYLNRFQRSLIDVYLILITIGFLFLAVVWKVLKYVLAVSARYEYFARLWKLGFILF